MVLEDHFLLLDGRGRLLLLLDDHGLGVLGLIWGWRRRHHVLSGLGGGQSAIRVAE